MRLCQPAHPRTGSTRGPSPTCRQRRHRATATPGHRQRGRLDHVDDDSDDLAVG